MPEGGGGSLALSTAIAAVFDYPKAGSVARFAAERGLLVNDAAVEMALLSRQEPKSSSRSRFSPIRCAIRR